MADVESKFGMPLELVSEMKIDECCAKLAIALKEKRKAMIREAMARHQISAARKKEGDAKDGIRSLHLGIVSI